MNTIRDKICKDDPKIPVQDARDFAQTTKEACCEKVDRLLTGELREQHSEANLSLKLTQGATSTYASNQNSMVNLKKLALLRREDHIYREEAEKLLSETHKFGQKLTAVTNLLNEAVRLHWKLSNYLTLRAHLAAKIHWVIWDQASQEQVARKKIQRVQLYQTLKEDFPELLEIAFT